MFDRNADHNIIDFLEKYSNSKFNEDDDVKMVVECITAPSSDRDYRISLNDLLLEPSLSREIINKIRTSSLIIFHNSTNVDDNRGNPILYGYLSLDMPEDERANINAIERRLDKALQKAASPQRDELNLLIGEMSDGVVVNFQSGESDSASRLSFDISLTDNNVDVPLDFWGSGTQNKARLIASLFAASKTSEKVGGSRNRPIVIIEEPESFLHPKAQGSFGKILISLSEKLGMQLLVSTHSPHMLNAKNSEANILLSRHVVRKKSRDTRQVPTDSENWKRPFSDHLGVRAEDFNQWKNIIRGSAEFTVLVEGATDKAYFELLRSQHNEIVGIPDHWVFEPYGGDSALGHQTLLQFVLQKIENFFVTFDLDVDNACSRRLEQIKLVRDKDFLAVGLDKPGYKSIEGLVPDRIISSYFSNNPNIVMGMSSADNSERRQFKERFKKELFELFSANSLTGQINVQDLKEFKKVINKIRVKDS